jgi:hypothetical protein
MTSASVVHFKVVVGREDDEFFAAEVHIDEVAEPIAKGYGRNEYRAVAFALDGASAYLKRMFPAFPAADGERSH